MKIVGLLSWYDEPTECLAECVTRVAAVTDHLVAVDGAYAPFPGADQNPASPTEQADAIASAAADAGLPVKLHCPGESWPSEVAKRDAMFRLAEPLNPDWYFRIDADEFIEEVPSDFRGRLAATDRHVAEVTLWEPGYTTPLRVLFRALPGLAITHAHNLVFCAVDGRRLILAGDSGIYRLEPAEPIHDLRIEHRRHQRPTDRREKKKAYYQLLPHLEGRPKPDGRVHQMKVRMRVKITGLLDGRAYPDAGQDWEVPDNVGARLCERGFAEPVVDDRVETAIPRKRAEKRS